jgi:outer membrane lipoprotein-sorting protein
MIMEDAFGQRTEMHFSNVVKNAPIDDAIFTFMPPKGVDLVGQPVPEQ